MTHSGFKPIRELRNVGAAQFREEILPSMNPVVLRGLVAEWPAVRAGRESPQAIANYLRGFDTGASADTMIGDPAIGGRFFYNDELTGHNFQRRPQRIVASIERLLALLEEPNPEALYVGAVPTPASMPGFTRDNTLPLVDASAVPRVWLCNRVTVQTHYDISNNIACVVAGRRRFTLFPPEQLVNLYVGPLEFTLAGQPISMVPLDQPDFERFPRFREALAAAQVADLEPGDALFVPYMWWHHVESRERFNVLVNYWWDETPAWQGSPFEALLHGIMAVRSLPPDKREIWRKVFDHYVFQTGGDPVAHLTQRQRGIQGPASPQLAEIIRAQLIHTLSRRRW
jgi:Cupin-like domain